MPAKPDITVKNCLFHFRFYHNIIPDKWIYHTKKGTNFTAASRISCSKTDTQPPFPGTDTLPQLFQCIFCQPECGFCLIPFQSLCIIGNDFFHAFPFLPQRDCFMIQTADRPLQLFRPFFYLTDPELYFLQQWLLFRCILCVSVQHIYICCICFRVCDLLRFIFRRICSSRFRVYLLRLFCWPVIFLRFLPMLILRVRFCYFVCFLSASCLLLFFLSFFAAIFIFLCFLL